VHAAISAVALFCAHVGHPNSATHTSKACDGPQIPGKDPEGEDDAQMNEKGREQIELQAGMR